MHDAASASVEPPREMAPASGAPGCPICNGLLIPLSGSFRCTRCHFTLCAGCEGADVGNGDGGE